MVVSFASVTQRSLPMRLIITVLLVAAPVRAFADEVLFAAARKGDVAAVRERLAAEADVNAKTPYGATALSFASEKGHLEIVRELLKAKADPNVKDTFYQATPMTWALSKNHTAIVIALRQRNRHCRFRLVRALVHAVAVKAKNKSKRHRRT